MEIQVMRIFICLTLIPLTQINVTKKCLNIRLRKGRMNNNNLIKKMTLNKNQEIKIKKEKTKI